MGKTGRMGPATPLQQALGVPWGVIYVGASFARTSRARAPRTAPFLGRTFAMPHERLLAWLSHQCCEKWASDATHSWKPSLPVLCNVVHEYSARATSGSKPK